MNLHGPAHRPLFDPTSKEGLRQVVVPFLASGGLPPGGTTGQILVWVSETEWAWVTPCTDCPEPPTAPTVTINQMAGQADPTPSSWLFFDVVFSEPVSGFIASDIVDSGSALATFSISGGPTAWTVRASAMKVAGGTVVPSIPANRATALSSGLANQASTSVDNQMTWTPDRPTNVNGYRLDDVGLLFTYGNYVVAVVDGMLGNTPNDGRVVVLDFTVPWAPTLVGSSAPHTSLEGGPSDGVIVGNLLYLTSESGPNMVWDVSNPAAPTHVGGVWGAAESDVARLGASHLVTGSRFDNRIRIYTLGTTPTNTASQLDNTAFNNALHLVVWGDFAAVTNLGNEFVVVDLSNRAAVTVVGRVTGATNQFQTTYGLVEPIYHNGYVYLVNGHSGTNGGWLTTLNVSSPSNPTIVASARFGQTTLPSTVHADAMHRIGSTLWVFFTNSVRYVAEYSLANPANPQLVRITQVSGMGGGAWSAVGHHTSDVVNGYVVASDFISGGGDNVHTIWMPS